MSETAVNGVEPIIFLDDVHVTFRTRTGSILHPNLVHAVQGVTIKLMPGQTIGIVGESGCGKSTTANVMCGLQAPTSGKVYFKGKDVTKRTAEDRRHMGRVISVVFQNPDGPAQLRRRGSSRPAFGRPAPARRNCPCPVAEPRCHHRRRAHLGSGRFGPRADSEPADRP